MFSDYSDLELSTLYLSLCIVLHNLRCDKCYGYANYGDDSGCCHSDFCNSLSIFKREILSEIGARRLRVEGLSYE